MTVLVVDDIGNMRQLVVGMLAELEIKNVFQASDGIEALHILRQEDTRIDLVISDWNMPRMSGIELLEEIRKDSELSKQQVLMLTAEAEKRNVITAVKLKVDGYIIKPVTQDKLEEKIKELLFPD